MSQFDFPRINFSGRSFVNPGTANNNVFLPLMVFDPINIKVMLPPRIYLSKDLLQQHALGTLPVPEGCELIEDGEKKYIEIAGVNTSQEFTRWMKTPLGKCKYDQEYHSLYKVVRTARGNMPLHGNVPAYWNYYGGMEFGFEEVFVRSVETAFTSDNSSIISGENENADPILEQILGAELSLKTPQGKGAAVMIDVTPTLAMHTQIFCDSLLLKKSEKVLLHGNPCKAALRYMNMTRIVNQPGVLGGSGTFFMAVPLQEIAGGWDSPFMAVVAKYAPDPDRIQGILLRFNLFEVDEDQNPDYALLGEKGNPARSTLAGSITPWYMEEMKTISMGRQLKPAQPFSEEKRLASLPFIYNKKLQLISLDLLGSLPMLRSEEVPTTYKTFLMGELRVVVRDAKNNIQEVGRFAMDETNFGREQLLRSGGIVDIPQGKISEEVLETGLFELHRTIVGSDTPEILMQEEEFMVASDQSGLYANQYDTGSIYTVNGPQKEKCVVRVYSRGRPITAPVPMTIMELKITDSGSRSNVSEFLNTETFHDRQTLDLPTDEAANSMFVFYPGKAVGERIPQIPEIIRSGYFVSFRVLPKHDYGKYLDPNHPDYPTPVTFDFLYEQYLNVYEMIYPISSIITPFTEEHFKRGWKFIQYRMSPQNWGSYTYMPSNRNMSEDQWLLFNKWAESLNTKANE